MIQLEEKKYVTVEEFADMLHVAKASARKYLRKANVQIVKIGRFIYIDTDDINASIDGRKAEKAASGRPLKQPAEKQETQKIKII